MDLSEINRRLQAGEELFCADCPMFSETEECLLICCQDPFKGPSENEIIEHEMFLTEILHKKGIVI